MRACWAIFAATISGVFDRLAPETLRARLASARSNEIVVGRSGIVPLLAAAAVLTLRSCDANAPRNARRVRSSLDDCSVLMLVCAAAGLSAGVFSCRRQQWGTNEQRTKRTKAH